MAEDEDRETEDDLDEEDEEYDSGGSGVAMTPPGSSLCISSDNGQELCDAVNDKDRSSHKKVLFTMNSLLQYASYLMLLIFPQEIIY